MSKEIAKIFEKPDMPSERMLPKVEIKGSTKDNFSSIEQSKKAEDPQ